MWFWVICASSILFIFIGRIFNDKRSTEEYKLASPVYWAYYTKEQMQNVKRKRKLYKWLATFWMVLGILTPIIGGTILALKDMMK